MPKPMLSPLTVTLIVTLFCVITPATAQFGDPVPRYPMEMDGPVNIVNHRALMLNATDISVPSRGLHLAFSRYYHSRGPILGSFQPTFIGYRWRHSFQWYLSLTSNPYGRYAYYKVHAPSGAIHTFKLIPHKLANITLWVTFAPEPGVHGSLQLTIQHGGKLAFVYTTKHGTRYKFEPFGNPLFMREYVLTEIADPNGNRIQLHYDTTSRYPHYTRLQAVEDPLGRLLKFSYGYTHSGRSDHDRYITKVEFGRGTPNALTTVYNTVEYGYQTLRSSGRSTTRLIKIKHVLDRNDPRGSERITEYEYNTGGGISAVVSPKDNRTEFDYFGGVSHVRSENASGTLLKLREYKDHGTYKAVHDTDRNEYRYRPQKFSIRQNALNYLVSRYSGRVTSVTTKKFPNPPPAPRTSYGYDIERYGWSYDDKRNITAAHFWDDSASAYKWVYQITYGGANPKHNKQQGNATKWEQVRVPSTRPTVFRQWTADYETTYNKPIWQIDPMGHRTEFSYDRRGNLIKTVSKANTGTQAHAITHDIITTHQYDAYGNRIKTTFMPGATQQRVVETVFDSTYHTYPIESKTTVTVNGVTRTIRTRMEWDVNRGLKTADIDALNKRTEYAYWKDGRLKYTRRVADNLYIIPTYDKDGNVTMTQARQNNWQTGTLIAQAKTEYDGMGRVKKAHTFNNNNWTTPYATSELTYDIHGNVSQSKDPRGLITNYTYGPFGKPTKQTLPDGDWVETRYNALGAVTKSWTSQTGTETAPAISHTYDTLNRLSTTTYSSGESVGHTYDKADNPLTMTTNDGSQTYTYTHTFDQLNRLITRTDAHLGYKTFYEYDDSSLRKRMYIRKSTGGSNLYDVKYTYDKANRLTSVLDVLASKTASYEYYDNGALKTTTLPNGITAHRTLDSLNRLNRLQYKKTTTTDLARLDYTYDVKSNVTRLVRNDTGAGGSNKTFTFGYDGSSRLTRANYGTETVSYTYDKVGNRTRLTSTTQGTTSYTIANNSNQLTYRSLVPEDTDFSTMSYTYDAEGKLTQRHEGTDSDAFTYGFGNRLKQVRKTRAGTLRQTVSYSYDGAGRRVKVTDSNGTRYYLYDGGMPVLELNASKQITASYLYGADGVVYRKKHTSTPSYEYHHQNALGSTIIETNNSKTVLARYEYDAFGAVRSQTGTSTNSRKFTGKEYDADVKLYYYSARYYDPYVGRFTSRDPIGEGVNWYAYAVNNPLKFIDPTGTRIVILGPVGQNGNSTPEVIISREGITGDPSTLSPEASQLFKAITGTGDAHPDLRETGAGKTVSDVINSDKTVYVVLDPNLNKLVGDTDFIPNSDDHIMLRITTEYAADTTSAFVNLRRTLVHELVHAAQAIADPARFRDRSYYNVYKLETEAYDMTARFAAELQGPYIKNLGFIPEYNLSRFNPNSRAYNIYIHMAAQASAARFR